MFIIEDFAIVDLMRNFCVLTKELGDCVKFEIVIFIVVLLWYTDMAPRKKLKATTSVVEPPQEYDADRFVSFATQKMYLDSVVKRGAL